MQKKKQKKKMSYKTKLNWLKVGSFFSIVSPLLIIIGLNFKTYFTAKTSVSLSIGAIITLSIIVLEGIKKVKVMKGWTKYLIAFILAYLFESIFRDIVMITGALLGGKTLDMIFFKSKIERYERLVEAKDNADVNAEVQKEVNKELIQGLGEVIRSGRA